MENIVSIRVRQFREFGIYHRSVATCSWEDPVIIWKVGRRLTVHRKLEHVGDVSQVLWSPDGKFILLQSRDGVEVRMTEVGVCRRVSNRLSFTTATT